MTISLTAAIEKDKPLIGPTLSSPRLGNNKYDSTTDIITARILTTS